MITIRQTDDSEFVTQCLVSPAVWRMGSDDAMIGVDQSLFFASKPANQIWLRAGDYGVFIGEYRNMVTYEAHVALLPVARGHAKFICRDAIRWMFSNTICRRITASIPDYNKPALRLAREVSMEFIGINKRSFMKNGQLYDQHLYGISKEDICHH